MVNANSTFSYITKNIPLPKSGDPSQPMNYRGIHFSSVTAKLVNKKILKRIQIKIDNKHRPNQNGFRPF